MTFGVLGFTSLTNDLLLGSYTFLAYWFPALWVSKLLLATVGTHITNISSISHFISKFNSHFSPFNRNSLKSAQEHLYELKICFQDMHLLFRSIPELGSIGLDFQTMLNPRDPHTEEWDITLFSYPLSSPATASSPDFLMTEWT